MVYVRAMSAQNRKIDVFLVKFSSQKAQMSKIFSKMSSGANTLICYLDQIEIGEKGKCMYLLICTNNSICYSYVSPPVRLGYGHKPKPTTPR